MIPITRGIEPDALANVRAAKLPLARTAIATSTSVKFTEYDIVKPALAAIQNNKCCYCEKREEQAKYRDVEHYRPKSRYWWLAWTWENLLFACINCNREHKRVQFPISVGNTPLGAEQAPPGGEQPLILDPSSTTFNPRAEIQFRAERIHGKQRWVPYGISERGRTTVEVCGLARPTLIELYSLHVIELVRPRVEPIFTAHSAKDSTGVVQAWATAKRSLLDTGRPFSALSFDALSVLVPAAVRNAYNLAL